MLEFVFFAPVTQRAWILPTYLDHLRLLNGLNPQNAALVFLYGDPIAEEPDQTRSILEREQALGFWGEVRILEDDQEVHYPRRVWNRERYKAMARMRNRLLEEVRDLRPNLAFSVDTDILLPQDCLEPLLDDMIDHEFEGIAPLTYMTSAGTNVPNAMDLTGQQREPVKDETMAVGACFGAVMMSMDLYQNVDYTDHRVGEDLGWANRVASEGMTLGICPRVKAKHVMKKEMLDAVDPRVGF